MKLGLALRRRLARFQGLPDEVAEAIGSRLGLPAQLERGPARLVEPPPRSMVWLACWDFRTPGMPDHGSLVNYAPSQAPLPTAGGGELVGQFSTLAIGSAVFQVFTVDYVEAGVRKAKVWNPNPPPSIAKRLPSYGRTAHKQAT